MRKLKSISFASVLFGTIMLTITGCYKDTFNFDDMKEDFITWEPDLAIPLVYSTLTAQDIIAVADSTNIYQIDNDNFITLIYRARIFSQTINDFFQLPLSESLNTAVNLDAGEITQFTTSGTVSTTENRTLSFGISGPGGAQLDVVEFFTGSMNISFTSDFEHSGQLFVSMPQLTQDGIPFGQSYNIDYQGSPVSVNISIPLAGYKLDLDNGNGPNTVPIDYTLTLNQGAGLVPTPVNSVDIDHSFDNMSLFSATGDFGNFNLNVPPGDVDLDLLRDLQDGSIFFEDPRLKLYVKNGIGADMRVSIPQLFGSGAPGVLQVDVSQEIPGTPPSFVIDAAPSLGDSTIVEYYFTQDNSNIKPLINQIYDKITYDVDAEMNPNGPASNFALRSSAIEVTADVELPFYGYSDHYTIVDTIEIPLNEVDNLADNIERGLLRINTVSQFPVDGILKLYFADESYNILDSVLTDGSFLIRSGIVEETTPFDGNTFRVVAPTQTNTDVELDSARINSLFQSKYLFLSSDLTSSNDAQNNIKVFTDDNIEVRIGLRVKLKADPTVIDEF